MSKRRRPGDWVWLRPYSGFVAESHRLRAQIQPEEGSSPCFLCDDPDCREWSTLWTEEDPGTGKRYVLCHVSECQMLDEQWSEKDD